jgi:hypothetical protein
MWAWGPAAEKGVGTQRIAHSRFLHWQRRIRHATSAGHVARVIYLPSLPGEALLPLYPRRCPTSSSASIAPSPPSFASDGRWLTGGGMVGNSRVMSRGSLTDESGHANQMNSRVTQLKFRIISMNCQMPMILQCMEHLKSTHEYCAMPDFATCRFVNGK